MLSQTGDHKSAELVRPSSLDLRLLHHELAEICDSNQVIEQKSLQLIELAMRLTNAAAGVLFTIASDGAISAGPRYLSKQALTWSDALLGELALYATAAISDGRMSIVALERRADAKVITVPVSNADEATIALSILLVVSENSVEQFAAIVSLIAFVSARVIAEPRSISTDQALWDYVQDISSLCANGIGETETQHQLLELLRSQFNCDHVVLGLKRGNRVDPIVPAALSHIDRRADFGRALVNAMREAISSNRLLKYGSHSLDDAADSIVLRDVASALSAELVIADSKRNLAAIVVWEKADERALRTTQDLQRKLLLLDHVVGASLPRSFGGNFLFSKLAGVKYRIALSVVALTAVLAFPVTHKISAGAVLEPIERRYIVAPFDANLDTAFFKPGDVVSRGAVLAKLDGDELLLEIEGIEAELEKTRNRRRSAVAVGNTGEAQLAQLEFEKLDARLKVLAGRREKLDIPATIDGVLLAGDLERNSGSPLRTGQTLFEIAPLDEILVSIRIPARDIRRVQEAMPVSLRFEALPQEEFASQLDRIRPRAQVIDQNNVVIGEALIDNTQQKLKPGMTARAKLHGERRSLGWVLFHRAWYRMRLWFW